MMSDTGKVALVYNGEIYNFPQLRAELEAKGHRFHGHSDTEILLCLYEQNRQLGGDLHAMLRRLNGIFSFALWDAEENALLLVRDALGVKPLYYSVSDRGFAFSSEIKALHVLGPGMGDLDAASIDRYLSFLWCPGEGTPVKNIKKLGPGEMLWVRESQVERRASWYRLPIFNAGADPMGKEEAIAGTRLHFRQAVQRQMISDVPVGAFLSGGLDSSAVVAMAREQNPDIRCFTIETTPGEEDGTVDDLPYARRVAKHLNVPLEVVCIDSAQMARDLEMMVAQLDEPLSDPAPLNVFYISRLAREHGIKVLLSGAGGDDLFTGYRRHRAVQVERVWSRLPLSMRNALEKSTVGLDQRRAFTRRLRKLFSGAPLDGDERLVNYFRWIGREDLSALYTPAFRAALGDAQAEGPMLEFLSGLSPDRESLERMLALEERFFLTDHNLTYTDKMSMAAGVEVRVPFLDLNLVDFANRIPVRFKQRGGEGKWVLKKAMEPHLPHDIIYRPKTGFGAPLRRWMRNELRELLGDYLSADSLRKRGLFDPKAVQELIKNNDAGRVDAAYTLLSLLCIEIWCRYFVDDAPACQKKNGDAL